MVFPSILPLRSPSAARQGVPVFEVVLVRSLTLLAFTVPVLVRQKVNPFGDQRRWLYVLRGVLGFGSVSLLYYAGVQGARGVLKVAPAPLEIGLGVSRLGNVMRR